jgi:hypothetical protein
MSTIKPTRMACMPTSSAEFKTRLVQIVQSHYAARRTPLLLARLGTELDKADAWPEERGQRNLKQLINEFAAPDVELIWDKRSPAYIAVVTPDVRETVIAQMEERLGVRAVAVRLEEIVRPVLLAFCINVHDQPVYVRRVHPFRYEVGEVDPEQASNYVLVETEYRRPGLRVERLQSLSPVDKADLANRIQRWAAAHGLTVEQFYKSDKDAKDVIGDGGTALDRLIAAQAPDVAPRLMVPADIAQILSRLR